MRRQHDVIDGAAGAAARGLDGRHRHRPDPGPLLGPGELALQQVTVRGQPGAELGQHGGVGPGKAEHVGDLADVSEDGPQRGAEVPGDRGSASASRRSLLHSAPGQAGRPELSAGVVADREHFGGPVPSTVERIGHGHDDLHQGHAIGDGMVDAQQQRAAGPVSVQQVQLPEWPVGTQRAVSQLAGDLLQGGLVARSGQPRDRHVIGQHEGRIVRPPGRGPGRERDPRVGGPLPEPAEAGDHPVPQHLHEHRLIDRPVEPEQHVDHHEIVRAVHMQPRRVGRVHRLGADRGADHWLTFPISFHENAVDPPGDHSMVIRRRIRGTLPAS